MSILPEEDLKKIPLKLALQAAALRFRPRTGYIHFWEEDPCDLSFDTVPVAENFYYAYSLIRSKTMQNLQTGAVLLERLLAFGVEGNYPVYLHEFPRCRDEELSSRLLPLFFSLLRDYRPALGEALAANLASDMRRISRHIKSRKESSCRALNRIAASEGKLLSTADYGEGPESAAEFCIALQTAGLGLEKIAKYWDPVRGVYIGPSKERRQEGKEPAVTLLDIFMGEHFGIFSRRALHPHSVHLRAGIVLPIQEKSLHYPKTSYSVIVEEKKPHPFTVYWGREEATYSLVFEYKKGSVIVTPEEKGVFRIIHRLEETLPGEEESEESTLYVSDLPGVDFSLSLGKATLFREEPLAIHSPFGTIQIRFSGRGGIWTSHLSKGNRAFQMRKEGYQAFDRKIARRTVRRDPVAETVCEIDLRGLSL